jgi:fatty acid desaturase
LYNSAVDVVLTDPTYSPSSDPPLAERIASPFVRDRRDAPFVRLMALLTLTVVPTGVALFLPGVFHWWLGWLHFVLIVYFLGPFVLMLHNTSHRKLFRRSCDWMNLYIPWVLGPFFGQSPETYFAHHVGMHHAENNLEDDVSSTLPYRRDSFVDFLHYFVRFFFFGGFELTRYFKERGRRTLLLRFALGEFVFVVVTAALLWCNWRATLLVFVLPFVVVRFGMMAGNWAQHAFVDESSPENNYRNSITCINSGYNRRCFNDGYHIGHHLKSTRHWTEMPEEFSRNIPSYERERAIVFEGLDYFGVWLRLMAGRYDLLAERFVPLGACRPTTGEIIAMLRGRAQWTSRKPLRMTTAQPS